MRYKVIDEQSEEPYYHRFTTQDILKFPSNREI